MGCGVSKPAVTAPAPSQPDVVQKTPTTLDTSSPEVALLVPGKPQLTLEAADSMSNTALRQARERGFKDISVVVLDAAGRTLVQKTMVNCPKLIPELALGKASICIATHASSRAIKDKYVPERTPQLLAMTTIGTAVGQPLAAFPGGVLCRDEAKNVVGAIGVSGAAADEDEHCAITAAQAAGLVTEPATSALSCNA